MRCITSTGRIGRTSRYGDAATGALIVTMGTVMAVLGL